VLLFNTDSFKSNRNAAERRPGPVEERERQEEDKQPKKGRPRFMFWRYI